MEHVTDIQMMMLLGGHSPPDQRHAAEEHLAACDRCRARYQQMAEVWAALGRWELPPGDHGVRERVLAAAGTDASLHPSSPWRRWALATLKAAASVVIAAGVGYAAGRWNRSQPGPPPGDLEHRVALSLYLPTFESGTPAGLSELVLAADEPAGEDDR